MREIIGVALSSVLFYLSNRMGAIIQTDRARMEATLSNVL